MIVALHVVTARQIAAAVFAITFLQVICAAAVMAYFNYRALPEVVYANGACSRVINFKNGDAYGCQDVDVILRSYRRVE